MSVNTFYNNLGQIFKTLLIALILTSCDDFSFQKGINHGKIEYVISYPDIPADNFMLDIMPKKMETTFKNNNYRNDIIAGMGLLKTSIIYKTGNKTLTHSFKMLNDKYYSELNIQDLEKMNPNFQNIEVKLIDETREIAGYICKGAEVIVKGDSTWNFKLFYTDEINIKDANLYTPFKEIKGVLMEYEINSYDTHMKFIADKVLQKEVNEADIELEEGYSLVKPEELKKQIESVFNKVK